MALINFPGRLDNVRERVVLASICPSSWPLVLQGIEEFFPQASARVERMPMHHAISAAPMLHSDRPGAGSPSSPREAAVSLDDGGAFVAGAVLRLGPTRDPQSRAAVGGAGLVMEIAGSEAVLLTVRFPCQLGQQYHAPVATLLRRLCDDLTLSYRVSQTLTHGGRLNRSALEAGWDRLMAGVALLSSRLRIQVANVATDDLLADRRFFLPPVSGVLRPAVKGDADRLFDAAARLLQGASDGESLAFAALRGPQRLLMRLYRLDRICPFGTVSEAVPRGEDQLIAVFEPEHPGGKEHANPLASTIASLTRGSTQAEIVKKRLCRA